MLKVFQFTSILLFCQALKGEPQCPNGSQYFEPLGYCLQAIKEAAPWGYAESYCQAFGGHLASIHNLMMNSVLNGVKDSAFNGSGCYVGGRKVNGSWTWSDGTKFSYQIWNPANSSIGDCIYLSSNALQWSTTDSSNSLPFICYLPKVQPPDCTTTTCPKGATYAAELGTCLLANQNAVSFDLAEKYCQVSNGHLASVTNALDDAYLTGFSLGLTSAKSFYIGGRRNGGNYQWMDGSPFTYTKWSIGEPRFDCVLLVKETGNWITTNCSSSYQFICELPAIVNGGCSTTALTTTPTTQSPITYPPPPSLICPSDELLYTCQSDPQYFNGFAYWVRFNRNFTLARQDCLNNGGDLVSIHSDEELAFVKELCCLSDCSRSFYDWTAVYMTGATNKTGVWVWTDGTPFNDFDKPFCSPNHQITDPDQFFLWINRAKCDPYTFCVWGLAGRSSMSTPYYVCKKAISNQKL